MAPDAAGVAIADRGRRVLLKWHKLRRRRDDPPFALANLGIGLAAGAALEIDVQRLADDHWVCLHDDVLDRETDGRGPVAAADRAAIGRLRLAGSSAPPPLLSDIASEVARAGDSAATLQLDLKLSHAAITDGSVARFAATVAPIAERCLLTGTDWAAVRRIGAAVPGLTLGFDPLDMLEARPPQGGAGCRAFCREILATAPKARAYYLHHPFVTMALAADFNPIAFVKVGGAAVDVWTLDPTTPDIESILPTVVRAGADQITTNDPIGLAELWESLR